MQHQFTGICSGGLIIELYGEPVRTLMNTLADKVRGLKEIRGGEMIQERENLVSESNKP